MSVEKSIFCKIVLHHISLYHELTVLGKECLFRCLDSFEHLWLNMGIHKFDQSFQLILQVFF